MPWPQWWNYEVVFSPHLIERMQERGLSEVDLRTMLNDADGFHASIMPGRQLISTKHAREP